MNTILQAENLTKIYGTGDAGTLDRTGPRVQSNICRETGAIVALNRVSLTLYEGEILGIMGESGSGKSTLLRLLNLDEPPTSGSAKLYLGVGDRAGGNGKHAGGNGRPPQTIDLFDLNPAQARTLRDRYLGIVRQNPRQELNFGISAGGNVAERVLVAGRRHYGDIRERVKQLLDRTGVPLSRIDQRPGGFSGGMQQRVQIARALATNPPLLLLDEVTTGLDLSVQARILDLILELHQQLRITMLVVTHDIGVVRTLAGRTIIMKDGCVVESGLTDQILEDPQHPYTQELVSAAL